MHLFIWIFFSSFLKAKCQRQDKREAWCPLHSYICLRDTQRTCWGLNDTVYLIMSGCVRELDVYTEAAVRRLAQRFL